MDCGYRSAHHGRRNGRVLLSRHQAERGDRRQGAQLASIVLVLPLMLALGAMNVLRSDTIGPLIGVVIGYAVKVWQRVTARRTF
jgi:hypothetical protein